MFVRPSACYTSETTERVRIIDRIIAMRLIRSERMMHCIVKKVFGANTVCFFIHIKFGFECIR
jgi:hypothetical protein